MLKHKKFFYISIILFLISVAFNFTFPNDETLGAKFSVNNIPITKETGLNYVGITSILLLIASFYFLSKSFKKFRVRIILIALFISVITPSFLANAYQKTMATDIYAVSYERSKSRCNFEMKNETILHAECELPFKNYRNSDVLFTIDFYNKYPFEDEGAMLSLMKKNAPYKVKLGRNESKVVKIETDIDVSTIKNHVDSGETTEVHMMIISKGKSRKI
ncbi:hypothetical protein BED47_01950 [Gottfriedia luciferensis]|uniref:Uncharacterized protein n=1 Tax=Gottfriedia luciferensis TaxID=178774 RepID=A0ABX2ZZH3_9BACI|nr:hypothetical protein [Gottfriedia luciferensis]ODG93957.1 hypothetical protein BED47_01950 [Gottfriedia luciferensis]